MGRRCVACDEQKALEAFNWADKRAGERQLMCRECFSEYNRQRYLAKREDFIAVAKARYWADPEASRERGRQERLRHLDARRAYAREYQREHADERRPYKAAWLKADRAANPEKYREKGRAYRQAHPDRENEKARRYRARKLAATVVEITDELLNAKWYYHGGLCWMGGEPAVEWDHVKPLARGGSHCLANLRPACRKCNASKGDTWPWPT